jgi:hypothetical protein
MLCVYNIFQKKNMTKQSKSKQQQSNYTDIRTGIVYANVDTIGITDEMAAPIQPHLDAFIPPAFLKAYFGKEKDKEKSNSDPGAI